MFGKNKKIEKCLEEQKNEEILIEEKIEEKKYEWREIKYKNWHLKLEQKEVQLDLIDINNMFSPFKTIWMSPKNFKDLHYLLNEVMKTVTISVEEKNNAR